MGKKKSKISMGQAACAIGEYVDGKEHKGLIIADLDRIVSDDNFQELLEPGINILAEKFDNPKDKSAFKEVTQGKIFDIGEHKDDKRYIEYLDNGKTTRKYKDNCKLTYIKDSAGKAINFKWITYKH